MVMVMQALSEARTSHGWIMPAVHYWYYIPKP